MTNTQEFIEKYKDSYVKNLFNDNAMYDYVYEARDVAKIDKLLTIKSLDNFYNNVRKFTKNVYSDHSIARLQCLAELREIQLDLQQNYKHLLDK